MGIGPAGDSFVYKFSNGNKYIFFSTGPEGNIYGAELRPPGKINDEYVLEV